MSVAAMCMAGNKKQQSRPVIPVQYGVLFTQSDFTAEFHQAFRGMDKPSQILVGCHNKASRKMEELGIPDIHQAAPN